MGVDLEAIVMLWIDKEIHRADNLEPGPPSLVADLPRPGASKNVEIPVDAVLSFEAKVCRSRIEAFREYLRERTKSQLW